MRRTRAALATKEQGFTERAISVTVLVRTEYRRFANRGRIESAHQADDGAHHLTGAFELFEIFVAVVGAVTR
jgi:hypothetical protein